MPRLGLTTVRNMLVSLFFAVATLTTIASSDYQECSSAEIVEYANSYNNASHAVLIEIDDIVKTIISGFNTSNSSLGNSTQLFEALSASLKIETSTDDLLNFETALDQITNAYFEACYGTLPLPSEVSNLVYNLITKLNGLSQDNAAQSLPEIRRIFGRLTCIIETYSYEQLTNDTSSVPSIAPSSSTVVLPSPTPIPSNVSSINCTDLGGTYISVTVFYECVHSEDLRPIFGIGPIVTIDDEIVILKRCIGFVVDTTGSMSYEISYVRQLILNFTNSESILPACYALVDFNDYDLPSPEASELLYIH